MYLKKIYLKNQPVGQIAKTLYAIAEKIRYEKIGCDKLKGIKNNIIQSYEDSLNNIENDERISNVIDMTSIYLQPTLLLYQVDLVQCLP